MQRNVRRARAVRRKRCRWKSAEQLSNSSPFLYGFLNDGEENTFCPLCGLLCGEDTTPSRAIACAKTSEKNRIYAAV